MVNDEAFLRAVADDPADETTRLVYADWLDERDDPRGEYIRLQVEIERTAPHTDRYVALRTRLKALRGPIDSAWKEAMGYRPRHRPLFATLPETRQNRWCLVEEFIEVWHGPLRPEDGYSEAELQAAEQRLGYKLPAALREWYALAGRRNDVWSHQDHLWSPDQLWIDLESTTLIIRSENQGCERWGIRIEDLGQDDPPVIEIGAGVQSSPTTTAFATLVLIYEVKFANSVLWAGGSVAEDVRTAATGKLSQCDLPDRYWVMNPLQFFEGNDLIVELEPQGWLYVAARGEEAFRQLDEEVCRQLTVYQS
jgi:uncharacterized protein (TIGR02996 family)